MQQEEGAAQPEGGSPHPDLVVGPHEGVGAAADGARVLGDPDSVLVLNDAQLERVRPLAGASGCCLRRRVRPVGGYAWCVVEWFWMAVASGTSINRQQARGSVYSVLKEGE